MRILRSRLQIVGIKGDEKSNANKHIVTYNMYMQLGTDGLRGLANFNVEHKVKQPPLQTYNYAS